MKLSSLVTRIGGSRVDAWQIHAQANAAAARGENVIVLSVGDPEFAAPQSVTERAAAALRAGDTHYTTIIGRAPLRERIAARHQAGCGQVVDMRHVVVTSGAQNALFVASLCLCEHGDEVLVPEPLYLTYEATVRASGASLVPVPVRPETGFRLDLDALRAAVTPRTRAIFLATPCNPTGVAMRRDELQAIAALALAHDLWVVSDEVYASLVFDGEHVGIAGLDGMAERTVTVSSLSKSHAMAGFRLGWAVAPAEVARHMGNLLLCMTYGAPGFVQEAACQALDDSDAVTGEIRALYRRRRDQVCRLLADVPGLRCPVPQAGMFVLLDVRATGLSSSEVAWGLFRQAGVSVLDAQAFGPSAEGFLRMGLVVDDDRLAEACRRIRRYMASLG
ncbi:aminotransferase class I/II-fold pyridoxal phosphate-dependent enzyme [Comamonadaceae bacterium G21597-S1]|nr:aminotransferase class I/II-fold pyridoxal phosphate-dependent enzyme [Comamonadaceae bacterium G21597-S1]